MAQAPLVERQVEIGKQIVNALKDANFNINAALWWYSSDPGRWSLMIASDRVAKNGPTAAYRTLHQELAKRDILRILDDAEVQFVEPDHRMISLLRDYFHGERVRDFPLKQSVLNGQTIPDAYLYCM